MAKKNKKKGNGLSINFKGVEVRKTLPEGTYVVEVAEVELTESSNGNEMIKWEFIVAEGKHQGAKLWYNTVTTKESLFKLREVLEALGQEVPDGKMDIDLSELVGCRAGVNVLHDVYEGKTRAVIADWLSAEEVDETEEDDEEEVEEEEEDDEENEDEESVDVSDMDEDDLKEVIEEHGLDVDLDDYSSIKKKRKAVEEALSSGGDEEEEEEEEAETYTEDQINDMDKEELEKLNEDLELDIDDIDDMKPKAARKAVIKALKKAKLIEK